MTQQLITDEDMRHAIAEALGEEGTPDLIESVFAHIHATRGLCYIADIEDFWEIVESVDN